ncbi:MAG: thiol peroxidase [Gammaproteobacteria bacterium]|nr:MAG: thiol peroxidase [Gammaproteobacteria bacterium]
MAQVTLQGKTVNLVGRVPAVGRKAPDFRLVDGALKNRSLSDYAGKKKVISVVPSLDTEVCAVSTRKFHEKLGERDDVVVLVVSVDTPFAQKRFCTTENLDHVVPLSMIRNQFFGKDYGLLIMDGPLAGFLARAVLVVDEEDNIIYQELVGEIAHEPDYEAVLKALGSSC